jgi:hypothetical protein
MAAPSPTAVSFPWNDLLKKVERRECIPIIGAGVSYPALPRACELSEELLKEDEAATGEKCPLTDRKDLAKVCQYLAVTHSDSRWPKERIAERIQRATAPDFRDPAQPHRALANLRLPIYITTNYDDFMSRALKEAGAKPRQEFARWTETMIETENSTFDEGYRPSVEEPVVFHLHGHTGFVPGMVASDDDYLDFLVTISRELKGSGKRSADEPSIVPPVIQRALRYNRLLFVGYGLADVNFRVMLRAIVGSLEKSARQLNVSVQYSGRDVGDLENYLGKYFNWMLDLNVFWITVEKFAAELASRTSK